MGNIKFIGRRGELKKIRKIEGNFFLVVKGRRRIGKTMLLRKTFPDGAYIFIWPDKSIDWICQEICSENGLLQFKNFKDIIENILDKRKTIILDEFQNFLNIDKSIYGEIQKIVDERKISKKFCKISVAGSSYSLMNKVFNNSASPLYGRRTHEIVLTHIAIKDLFNEIKFPIEEFIKLWAVFEGVPYYYELINKKKSSEENIIDLIVSKNSQLKEEGKAILSVEFGKDSKTYNTVLTAIAEGKTKLNEISSLFNNKKNETIKYLDILRREFNLVKKMTPITENPAKSRIGNYEILDNFLSFWLYFYDKNRSYAEQERFNEILKYFNNEFNTFVGRKFEKLVISLIKEKNVLSEIDFSSIGNQWGKSNAGAYEIDLIALNEAKKEILFCECKWKEKVNSLEVLKELKEKTSFVVWNKENRKESFAIFSKSFSKKISKFNGRRVYCFDLKDIEKLLKKK